MVVVGRANIREELRHSRVCAPQQLQAAAAGHDAGGQAAPRRTHLAGALPELLQAARVQRSAVHEHREQHQADAYEEYGAGPLQGRRVGEGNAQGKEQGEER